MLPVVEALAVRPRQVDTATEEGRQYTPAQNRVRHYRLDRVRRHAAVPHTCALRQIYLRRCQQRRTGRGARTHDDVSRVLVSAYVGRLEDECLLREVVKLLESAEHLGLLLVLRSIEVFERRPGRLLELCVYVPALALQ